jgi:hypothetical protein
MKEISAARVRLGVGLFILFWLPIWLLGPALAEVVGITVAQATLIVGTIQVILGILGFLMIGKQTVMILRHSSRKQAPKIIWHIFWSGTTEN